MSEFIFDVDLMEEMERPITEAFGLTGEDGYPRTISLLREERWATRHQAPRLSLLLTAFRHGCTLRLTSQQSTVYVERLSFFFQETYERLNREALQRLAIIERTPSLKCAPLPDGTHFLLADAIEYDTKRLARLGEEVFSVDGRLQPGAGPGFEYKPSEKTRTVLVKGNTEKLGEAELPRKAGKSFFHTLREPTSVMLEMYLEYILGLELKGTN